MTKMQVEDILSVYAEIGGMLAMSIKEVLQHLSPQEDYQKRIDEHFATHFDKNLHDFMEWYVTTAPGGVMADIINWHFKGPNPFDLLLPGYEYLFHTSAE